MTPRAIARILVSLAILLLTAVSLLSAGCTPAEDGMQETDTSNTPAEPETADGVDGEWLAGTWTVDHTLDDVSPAMFAEAADQDEVVAVITIEGNDMLALVEDVTYSGPVVFGGENFRYEGASTYVDDDGTVTESDIVIDGLRTGEDSWQAEMWGEIRTEGEYLYEATWTQTAIRVD